MVRRIRVSEAAITLIVVQALVRLLLLYRSYFWADDFWYLSSFAEKSLGAFLFQNYSGHLMPGQFLIVAVLQWLAPFHYSVVIGALVALQTWAAVVVWRLLRELVGVGWPALSGLAVFLFAPLAVVPFVWYAAALQTVPFQLVVASVLYHHVRFVRTRVRREAMWAWVWFVAGLLLWEKSLVVLMLVALLSLLWFPLGAGLRGAIAGLWRDRQLWLVYLVTAVVYLPVFVALTTQVDAGHAPLDLYPRVLWRALTSGVVPYLLGGPFSDAVSAVTAAGPVTNGGWYLALFGALVVATLVRRPSAWKAWSLVGAYLLVNTIVITSSRGGYFGELVGMAPRYFADVTVVAAIGLVLALAAPAEPVLEAEQPAPPRLAWMSLGLVYVVASIVTSLYVVQGIPRDHIRTYVGAARNDLAALGEVVVFDGQPDRAVLPLGSVRQLLLAFDLPVHFETPTDQLYEVAADGHIVPVDLHVATRGKVHEHDPCGVRVDNGTRTRIDLDTPLFAWHWVVRLDYFIGSDAAATVTIGGVRQSTVVRRTSHQLFLTTVGELDHIDVGVLGGSAPLCITGVSVGSVASGG